MLIIRLHIQLVNFIQVMKPLVFGLGVLQRWMMPKGNMYICKINTNQLKYDI